MVVDVNCVLVYYCYLQCECVQWIIMLIVDLKELEVLQVQIVECKQKLQGMQQDQKQQVVVLEVDCCDCVKIVVLLEECFKDQCEKEQVLGQDVKVLEMLLVNLCVVVVWVEVEWCVVVCWVVVEKVVVECVVCQVVVQGCLLLFIKVLFVVVLVLVLKVGGLGWLLFGNLLVCYGGKLFDGCISSGVLIGVLVGSMVMVVVDGIVVFFDWMIGYGMILIVDYGNGYMSFYVYNDILLKDVGVWVSRGDVVVKVGNFGGQGVIVLYFELCCGGQLVNLDSWLQWC